MNRVKRASFWAGLLLVLAVVATGCVPRGGVVNPGWTVVTVSEGVVYTAMASGQVLALDAARGTPLWQYPATQQSSGGVGCSIAQPASTGTGESALDAVYGLPVVADNLLLVTALDGALYAFDISDGARAFDLATNPDDGAIVGGVTLYDGVAYYGSGQSLMGTNIQEQSAVWDSGFVTGNRIWGAPAVDADHVYVGSMDHSVYAVDRSSGQEVWRYNVGASVAGSVTLADGRLFVGAIDSRLHALDASSGQLLWQTDVLDGWVWGEALVVGDTVYFGSLGGQVYALSVTDGASRWQPAQLEGAVRAGPVLLDKYLVFATDAGGIYTVGLDDGAVRERFKAASGVLSRPAVDGNMIFLGTSGGQIVAIDLESPIDPQVWIYPPAKK